MLKISNLKRGDLDTTRIWIHRFATGTIARSYMPGSLIEVKRSTVWSWLWGTVLVTLISWPRPLWCTGEDQVVCQPPRPPHLRHLPQQQHDHLPVKELLPFSTKTSFSLQELLSKAPLDGGRWKTVQRPHWGQVRECSHPAAWGHDLLTVYSPGFYSRWPKSIAWKGHWLDVLTFLAGKPRPHLTHSYQMTYTAGNNFGWGPQSAEVEIIIIMIIIKII